MSQDQSLSTEDLAGRQGSSRSTAAPAATGAPDTPPPPPTDAVGDERWTADTDRIRTAEVSDQQASDHDVSDPGVTVNDPGASGYGDTPAAGAGNGAPSTGTSDDGSRDTGTSDDGGRDAGTSDDGGRDAGAAEDGQRRPDDEDVSLVDDAQAEQYRARWAEVQVRFVDDPREAVGAADALVAEAMQSLASAFADHKSRLETQWHGGGDVDTEELRVALRRYRAFFHRLLEN